MELGEEGLRVRKEAAKTSSMCRASASVSPSVKFMGSCQGAMANIRRSTRASVRSSAFLHMSHESVMQCNHVSHTRMHW